MAKCVKNLVNGGANVLKYSFFCSVINSLVFIACLVSLFESYFWNYFLE